MTQRKPDAPKAPPFTLDHCQPEIDAVNAAQSTLKGLEDLVEALQIQLQNAATPEKAGIVAEIREFSENEIPAAKTKLESAQAALNKCRHSFGILTTTSPPPARQ
jgi:hypothetical protein